jgi:hypothetical protein
MQKLIFYLASLSLFAMPLQANAAQYQNGDVRMGAFVGARFQIQLGERESSRPRAALMLAPTLNRTSGNGINRTIGEGVALNFGPGSRPNLTLAGVRADTTLALHRSGNVDSEKRLGISSGGWVAFGLGVVAIGGGLYFLHLVDEANDHSE